MENKIYTTEAKLANYLGDVTIVTGTALEFILAAQKYIDEFTTRNFKADAEESSRLYNGNGKQYITIDDCISVTKVEVGVDIWGDNFTEIINDTLTRYFLMPINHLADGLPIRKIGLRDRLFVGGHANHRITAKWGYSATVPDDISFAATVLASGMYYENRGGNTGSIKSEKIGEYQVSYADKGSLGDVDRVRSILESYKIFEI